MERQQRHQRRVVERRRQARLRHLHAAPRALAVVAVAGDVVGWLSYQNIANPPPGQKAPIARAQHIAEGRQGAYAGVPLASVDHLGTAAAEGVHSQPTPNERQVHNLEQGQILLQHTCPDCPELVEQFKDIARRYPRWLLVAPCADPRVGARIALTTWGHVDTFDEHDEARIVHCIEAYRNQGPEKVIRE